jgi:type I restriction-modification system DNA methylase subunit
LIPAKLFLKDELKTIVKDFMKDNSSSNFYNAILQNLFFGTLNQKMNERKFADEKGYPANKKEYGVKNLYRYADKFLISKNEVLKLFEDIPFLNGGLFDCLDKENETGKVIYIDGFSRNKAKQTIIPDYLFFQKNEEKVDLSQYGLGSNKPVRGLFEILNNYNFTIDENTPIDQEIALDPELLGKVFENLLASYNPETATTARKETGSYYTPREIVDYMVETSLFEYLKEKLPDIKEEKIKLLLSYSEEIPEFSEKERQKIISAIDEIKILDPACGSGAFPMGVLHKLVFVLQKLDPENKYWHELQYQKAIKESKEVFTEQGDKNQREERLKEINETFDEGINYPDYARKLYLIENCIYGIDIQPIAIQISKLRFFISLVLDQKVDSNKENLGIRALPNLETRFVAANTLIGLEIPKEYELFQNTEVKQILDKLAKERHKYFNAKTRREKLDYQKQDKNLREELAKKIEEFLTKQIQDEVNQIKRTINEEELKLKKIIEEPEDIETVEQRNLFGEIKQIKIDKKEKRIKAIKRKIKEYEKNLESIQKQLEGDFVIKIAKKIASFDLYDQNASADWFDSEWMFGVKDGFDIVIANPPYIKEYTFKNAFEGLRESPYYKGKMDIWYLFACTGIDLLRKETGILAFIAQNNWVTSYGASIMRNKVIKDTQIIQILDFGSYMIFESSDIQTMVMIFRADSKVDNYKFDYRRLAGNDLNFNDVLDLLNYNQNSKTIYFKPIIQRDKFIDKPLTFSNTKIDAILDKISMQSNFKLDKNEVANGIHHHHDRVSKDMQKILGDKFNIGDGIFVLSKEEKNNIPFTRKELELIKPSYTTKELGRYYANRKNSEWVIYTDSKFKYPENIKPYPNIKRHLDKFQKVITSDNKPYGLHRARVENFFKGEKIIAVRKCVEPTFTYTDFDCYVSAAFYVIKTARVNLKYLTALLNSKLIAFWLKHKGKMQGNNYQIDKEPLLTLPLKNIPDIAQKPFIDLVDKILELKSKNPETDISDLEAKIDQMVYRLYGLTEEEIKTVEEQILSLNHN